MGRSMRHKPHRIGGAPFGFAPARPADKGRSTSCAGPSSARSQQSESPPSLPTSAPHSARDSRAVPPARSAHRAKQYVERLVGQQDEGVPQEWALVVQLEHAEYLLREEQAKQRAKHAHASFISDLDKQRQVRRDRELQRQEEHQRLRREVDEQVARQEAEEELRRQQRALAARRFNEERAQLLEEQRRRLGQRRTEEIQSDHQAARAAREAQEREEGEKREKKAKEREQAVKVLQEADHIAKEKVERKKKEALNDADMMRKHAEMLDHQEKARAVADQERRDKLQKIMDKYAEGVGNELARLQAADEARAEREALARSQREDADRARRQKALQARQESNRVEVQAQLAAKSQRRWEAKQEDQQLGQQLRKLAVDAAAEEQRRAAERRQQREANAEAVRRQIFQRSESMRNHRGDAMDETERQMNRRLVERVLDSHRPDGLQLVLKKKQQEYRMAEAAL